MPSSSLGLYLAIGDYNYINLLHSLFPCGGKADIPISIAPLPFCTSSSKSLRISFSILGLSPTL